MIANLLIGIMAVLVIIQPTWLRMRHAAVFVGLTLLHGVFLNNADGLLYYGSAALTDVMIMVWLTSMAMVTKFTVALIKISAVSVLLNAAGWVMWQLYHPPLLYDAAFIILYTWTIITLIKKDRADVGGHAVVSGDSRIRADHNPIHTNIKHRGN